MKVFVQAITFDGEQALKEILSIKTRANMAQRLGLRYIQFEATKITDNPFVVKLDHKFWNNVPYTVYHSNVIKNTLLGVFQSCDIKVNLGDIEVLCE